MFICQKKFVENILKKFRILGCKKVNSPLVVNEKLLKDDGGNKVDETFYRSLAGNLLYLTITRPNAMYITSIVSRFIHSPSHFQLGVAKRVLRYIQSTMDFGIRFERSAGIKLISFCDVLMI